MSFPSSGVPAGVVSGGGLTSSDPRPFPPAEIAAPHGFATTSNGAAAPIDVISKGKMFGFVIVTLLVADTNPTCTLPNAKESGETVGFARIPVPLRVVDSWSPFPRLKFRDPATGPGAR